MIREMSAQEYLQRLKAGVSSCAAIDPGDRVRLPAKRIDTSNAWFVARGLDAENRLFPDDPEAHSPFNLIRGGALRLQVRVREIREGGLRRVEVEAYRFCVEGLPPNPNIVRCLRYDKSQGLPKGTGWDDCLRDNPQHPHAHMHVNFREPDANDLRLPTGSVCPLLLLSAFGFWYLSTYGT